MNNKNGRVCICPCKRFPGKCYYYNVLSGESACYYNATEKNILRKKKQQKYQRYPEPPNYPPISNPKTEPIRINPSIKQRYTDNETYLQERDVIVESSKEPLSQQSANVNLSTLNNLFKKESTDNQEFSFHLKSEAGTPKEKADEMPTKITKKKVRFNIEGSKQIDENDNDFEREKKKIIKSKAIIRVKESNNNVETHKNLILRSPEEFDTFVFNTMQHSVPMTNLSNTSQYTINNKSTELITNKEQYTKFINIKQVTSDDEEDIPDVTRNITEKLHIKDPREIVTSNPWIQTVETRNQENPFNIPKSETNYRCVLNQSGICTVYVIVDDKLKKFFIRNKVIEDNVKLRMDELICNYTQIMEEFIYNIIQTSSCPPPYTMDDVFLLIQRKYSHCPAVQQVIDKIRSLNIFCPKSGYIKKNIEPNELIKAIGYGVILIQSFRFIDDINNSEKAMYKLLQDIDVPECVELSEPAIPAFTYEMDFDHMSNSEVRGAKASRQVASKCLEQARIIENLLKILMHLTHDQCTLSVGSEFMCTYIDIFE